MIRARILAIACGYEDCNDFGPLRADPAFNHGQPRPERRGWRRPDHPIPSAPTRSPHSRPRRDEKDATDWLAQVANQFIATSSGEYDRLGSQDVEACCVGLGNSECIRFCGTAMKFLAGALHWNISNGVAFVVPFVSSSGAPQIHMLSIS
jgi:hypothetical protein